MKELARSLCRSALAAILRLRSHPLPVDRMRKIVVIAPHQDDESFGCGALISSARDAGVEVFVLFVTDGSMSHPDHPVISPGELASLRRKEGMEALRVLGVETDRVEFLGAPDGAMASLSLDASRALVSSLATRIGAITPDAVFIPSPRDGSSEHTAVNLLVRDALASLSAKPVQFEYLVWAWWNPRFLLPITFFPSQIFRITLAYKAYRKLEAMTCYRSQLEPIPPQSASALPSGFLGAFQGRHEYFISD